MRRVLMLAYFYPPIGGGGVQRSAKFAKYLPDFGWQPYIISTTESIGGEGLDETLLADVPENVIVKRASSPKCQPITWLTRRFPFLERLVRTDRLIIRVLLKPFVFPLSILEYPPIDIYFWWALKILPLACKMAIQERIDVIYTTSSPFSVLLVGAALRLLTGKPWVADFRDPWTHNPLFRFYSGGWRRWLDKRLEAKILAWADRVTFVAPMQSLFEWGNTLPDKCQVIYNGFDQADFARTEHSFSSTSATIVNILFLGTVYEGMSESFFAALAQLAEGNHVERMRINFVGECDLAKEVYSAHCFESVSIAFHKRVSHARAVQLMPEAQVLLLLVPGTSYGRLPPTGKIFEYMASRVPILAVVPEDGIAAKIIRETGTGCVVDTTRIDELAEVLRLIADNYEAFRSMYFSPKPEVIRQFERKVLTRKLAEVFNSLVEPVAGASLPAEAG